MPKPDPSAAAIQLAAAKRESLERSFITLFLRASGWTRPHFDEQWLYGAGGGNGTLAERQIVPGRDWAFDFVHPAARICIEINGGQGKGAKSGHGSWTGLERDATKQNAAVAEGWRPFVFTTSMLRDGGEDYMAPLMALLHGHAYAELQRTQSPARWSELYAGQWGDAPDDGGR